MIPTLLLAGLIVGLLIRTWWTIPALAAMWWAVVVLPSSGGALEGILVAAVNAAVGVIVGRIFRSGVDKVVGGSQPHEH